ncbi:class I SAM-dependent methyltransferase [Caproiciproducens sp. NJN-50]|nr:class I SAM-dependent methyltransferase [Caproiciproducens sp. NJN-50]
MMETASQTGEIREFFDRCAETWDCLDRGRPEKIAAIVTLSGVKEGSRVADIACGTGVLFPEILSRNPAFLLGTDLSEKMIGRARAKFSDGRLRTVASDCFELRESGFDTILIYNAYPHFPDKKRLAEKMASMLRKGGRLMIAHGTGRAAINGRHNGKMTGRISWELRSAEEEAAEFSGLFQIDMTADTEEIYFFSGFRK